MNTVVRLQLLTWRVGTNASDATNWTARILDDGGFDLDGRLDGDVLTAVFRRESYTINMDMPGLDTRDGPTLYADISPATPLAPLVVRSVDLGTGTEKTFENVPGGAHPCLQSVTPLRITVERHFTGKLVGSPARRNSMGFGVTDASVFADVSHFDVVLLTETSGAWNSMPLLACSRRVIPRHLGYSGGTNLMDEAAGSVARIASLAPYMPCYLVGAGLEDVNGKKTEVIKLLHHDQSFGALVCSSIAAPGYSRIAVAVYDINLHQMDVKSEVLWPESLQFRPTSSDYGRIDTTIGGALTMDRSLVTPQFYSYVDGGDGGCRIIYETAVTPPPAVPLDGQKELLPTAVTGPPGQLQWVTLPAAPNWTPVVLPLVDVSQDLDVFAGFVPGELATLAQAAAGFVSAGASIGIDTLLVFSANDPNAGPTTLRKESFDPAILALINMFSPQPVDPWASLWSPVIGFTDDDYLRIFDCTVSLSKHTLAYSYDSAEIREPDRVNVVPRPPVAEYRFRSTSSGQGIVQYRFPIELSSTDVILQATTVFDVDSLEIRFYYERDYSPGVLMSEQRAVDILQGPGEQLDEWLEIAEEPAAGVKVNVATLACKPIGSSRITVERIKVKCSTTNAGAIIEGLVVLALGWVAVNISGLLAALTSALGQPWAWAIVFAILVALYIAIYITAPAAVAGVIERKIREKLEGPDVVNDLDEDGVISYAGEGLAEHLAQQALATAIPPIAPDATGLKGRNRFHAQRFQMVFVSDGSCRILLR